MKHTRGAVSDEGFEVLTNDFTHLKPGDTVIRLLAGVVPMEMTVTAVEGDLITMNGGWAFDRKTGVEEDPELGWGVSFGATGSYLVKEAP